MAILGFFLNAVAGVLSIFLTFATWLLIARAILSWVSPDPSNVIVQFINGATEPLLAPVRDKIPPFGMFDMSVIVVLVGLVFLESFLVDSMRHYAQICIRASSSVVGM